jgi:hypothetical protein
MVRAEFFSATVPAKHFERSESFQLLGAQATEAASTAHQESEQESKQQRRRQKGVTRNNSL